MRNWEIDSRGRRCSSCGRPFAEEQVFHTLLDLTPDRPARADICERCWREAGEASGREGTAYWRSRFRRLRPSVDREEIKKSLVRRLLDKYIDSPAPEHVNLCFVLALLEERKKKLVVRGRSRDGAGNRVVIYEHCEDGKTYLVRDPGLSLGRAEEVEEQVKALLAEEEKAGPEGSLGEVAAAPGLAADSPPKSEKEESKEKL